MIASTESQIEHHSQFSTPKTQASLLHNLEANLIITQCKEKVVYIAASPSSKENVIIQASVTGEV